MIFYYHGNKINFHKKGFALGLVLRVKVFSNSEMAFKLKIKRKKLGKDNIGLLFVGL